MMFCPECGRNVSDDAKFCPNCGHNMIEEAEDRESEPPEKEPSAAAAPPPPAAPTEPGPAVPSEPAPPAATAETAREGAAEEMAGEDATAESEDEPAYQPYETPRPTPTPEQPPQPAPQPTPEPTSRPTGSAAPTQPPSATPSGPQEPVDQQPGQIPPGQQPPPPTEGPAPAGQAPEEKKTNWASICLIGCGIMLLLAILGGAGLFLLGRSAFEKAREMDPSTVTNQLDIWEPGEGPTDGGTEDGAGESGPETGEPGDGGPSGENLGEIIGRLGEAVEGVGSAMSASNIEGFDPSTVDAQMLPTFYGFMVALAQDNPRGMHQWMSPDVKEQWSPEENWEVAPHIEHLGYTLDEHTTLDDGTERFVIEESIRDNQENTESTISWEIHFEQSNGQWHVTYFE